MFRFMNAILHRLESGSHSPSGPCDYIKHVCYSLALREVGWEETCEGCEGRLWLEWIEREFLNVEVCEHS